MNNMDIEDEWNSFLNNEDEYIMEIDNKYENEGSIPKCSDLYISTTTKIAYLNQPVELDTIFWKIPLIHYYDEKNGILKKQMKFNLISEEEVSNIEEKLKNIDNYIENYVIKKVSDNSITKFKDVRKISIGLCKKDLTKFRSKKKSAFYNCFVLIIRYYYNSEYREIHVKVFNTGKLEIPGIQNDEMFHSLLEIVKNLLQSYFQEELMVLEEKSQTVLVNSNFNCGFLINREKLVNLLKYKYKIHATYDPCSYPGIQCKYKIDEYDTKTKEGIKISFMIFRTGSVLIVGKCNQNSLYGVFDVLKGILQEEYHEIKQNSQIIVNTVKEKKIKIRKKIIKVAKV